MPKPTDRDWAYAIAVRIADECATAKGFKGDRLLLEEVLENVFLAAPNEMRRLIGTSIIEADFFD